MNEVKIKVYGSKNFEIDKDIIRNLDDLNFSEDLNSGQGGLDIELDLSFENTDFKVGDFIEYVIFYDKFKSGLLVYSGVIRKIKRHYSGSENFITLECESLKDLLVKKEVNKTYSGILKSIVSEIIFDLGDNSCEMDFVGNQIFKNLVQDNSVVPSFDIDGSLFSALEKAFDGKTFFINQAGEIKDTFQKKHIFKFGVDIYSNEMEEDENGVVNVEVLAKTEHDINAGDFIKIVNTDSFLNLDNLQITKLDFSLQNKGIIIGEVPSLKIG